MMIAMFVGAGSSADEDSDSETDSDVMEVKMDQDDAVGYAYVGSHNFTPSAWGTISGSGFAPVLNVSVSAMRWRAVGPIQIGLGDKL
jgi:tyrosyl-DNA phosphodiesterase-1